MILIIYGNLLMHIFKEVGEKISHLVDMSGLTIRRRYT